MFDVVQGP